MRLLEIDSRGELSLTKDYVVDIPYYAILSHRWGAHDQEVTFKDLKNGSGKSKAGYDKIQFCGEQARKDGLQYFWVDTCCIDKASHSEISEAVNSMFRWYHNAVKCYVYLSDVSTRDNDSDQTGRTWESDFRKSRWFTRGWTLQELLAPKSVEFFSRDRELLGDKKMLEQQIHEITGIPIDALRGIPLSQFSVDERKRWAETRETQKKEDKAYCLLGIFDVSMSLRYGEGENALIRLERTIDRSLINRIETPLSSSSTVPFRRDTDFVDRGASYDNETLLGQIEQRCAVAAARVALVGIGGIGKSQLAIEYCYRLRERSPNTWVFWIYASNAERIEQGYRTIADRVKLSGRKDQQKNIFELVARWLRDEEKGSWLLILDNLDDDIILSIPQTAVVPGTQSGDSDGQLRQPLLTYLPQSKNGAVLITTRTSRVAAKLVEPQDVIAVDPMNDTDAILLLQKKLHRPTDNHDLEELARTLEYMPLAIVQAAAYIQEKGPGYDVRQYIEAFQRNDKRKTSLLDYEAGHLRRDPEAKNSIIMTWQISFNDIRDKWPLSADLLSLMSYFDRQGIPKEVLTVQLQDEEMQDSTRRIDNGSRYDKNAKAEAEDEDQGEKNSDSGVSQASDNDLFEENMARLRSYSFVSIGDDRQSFEMHGLVQLATRKWLAMRGEDERWKSQFYRKLNTVFPTADYENWGLCEMLFPHAKSAERQRPVNNALVQEWAQILRKAGGYAWAKGDYREAERMCKESVGVLSKILGAEHMETTYSLGLLASTYRMQGRWTEAEKIEVQVMHTRRIMLGEGHPSTLTSMANLASTYWYQGRWTEAEKIEVQVIDTRRRVLGEEHPDTLTSMANLASTYRMQGQWTEAEKIEVQVIDTRRRVLGEEHPDTLTSMANLASTYRMQGRWTEAEKIEVQVMETRRSVLGEEHPDTLTTLNNLAAVLQGQGKYKEAEQMSRQTLLGREKVLGVDHPSTLNTIHNLGLLYRDLSMPTEAERAFLRALAGKEQVLGPGHPSTFDTVNDLVNLYHEQGRLDDANQTYMEAVTKKNEANLDQSDGALSEVSSGPPSLISDSTDSSMQDKYNDVVEHLVEVFCAGENAGLIYREAVETFPRDKFRHNHDQLLKLYFKQLRHEARTESELSTTRHLRTSSCRNEVTSLVLKILQPFEESSQGRLTLSSLAERKAEREYSLNQMLRDSVVDPDSYNDHKKQHDINDNHKDIASQSSGSSTESDDESLIQNQSSSLQAIDAFLTGGKAFYQLKANLASLLHPPRSLEDALSSESIFVTKQYISRNIDNMAGKDKEKILALRTKGQSDARIAEFLLQNAVSSPVTTVEKKPTLAEDIVATGDGTVKNEAALGHRETSTRETSLIQPTLTGQAEQEEPIMHSRPQLVTWTCSCGVQLYDHYTEIVPGSLEKLQQRLRQENSVPSGSWHTFWNSLIAWTTSRPSTTHINLNDQANTASNTHTAQETKENGEQNGKDISRKAGVDPTSRAPRLSGSTNTSNILQSSQIHPAVSYLLLCFPEGLSGLRLHHQQILRTARQQSLPNQVINDKQLFHLLRKRYASERRTFISRFWPKTVIRVSLAHFLVDLSEYVELKHYACRDGGPNCKCIPPPDMIKPATNAQYHCVPRDPELKPPIGTNYLTHYFQNPDCIKSENLVCTLNQVPKRLAQCMATSGSQRVEAWGIEFEEGWDRGRFRNAIFCIVIVGCLIFAILWSVVLKDMQSAFGVASFFVAVLATIGGYVASAEPRIVHK